MLTPLAPPAAPCVTLAQAKAHLRVLSDDEDVLIQSYLDGAIALCADHTGRALNATTWRQTFAAWAPCLALTLAPVRDVVELTYVDADGAEQVLDPDDWEWIATPDGATVHVTAPWPTTAARADAIRVEFDAGYDPPGQTGSGDDPAFVLPAQATQCVLLLVGYWFDQRSAVNVGNIVNDMPLGVAALLAQLRIYR